MLIMEAMFRFQSKEIKDQILCNYSLGVARPGFIDKEEDRDRDRLMNGAYDDNIVFEDEQALFVVRDKEDEEEHVVDKNQWTQKQDEILIENY